ncbi:MAG TPA: hypothetical protein VG370_30540 [Chloroflexota bacterium]|nr:hypothetical protein [Chloroflexota bacterium]
MVGGTARTDEPDERAIHTRLLRRDAAATAVAFEAFYPSLVARLRRRHRLDDPQLAEVAAEQALLDYFEHPTKFDSAKGTLAGYLAMAAERDLLNLLDRERRRHARVVSIEDVALTDLPRNNPVEEAIDGMTTGERLADLRAQAGAGLRDPVDERVLRLMEEGVRATAAYAAVLGIGHLPIDEQRRIVKQAKDRLKKRLGRRRAAAASTR